MSVLRVALVHHGQGPSVAQGLAASVRDVGHDAAVIGGRATALDDLLARRGFTTPLTHLPATLRELARGHYDVAHAFSPQDAYAALVWRRMSGRPVIFSLTEPIERERLADRRLRLRLLSAALDESDAVIVPDERTREAAWRWLALEPPVLEPHDGEGHVRLYSRLVAQT